MNKLTHVLCACVTAVGFSSSTYANNLVTNGSFETASLAGWTADFGVVAVRTDYGATDGSFAAILGFGDVSPPSFSLSQVLSVDVGAHYNLTFDWGVAPNFRSTQGVTASIEGASGTLSTLTLTELGDFPTPFKSYSLAFTADSAAVTLRFLDSSLTNSGNDSVLDNVSVQSAVPEPASAFLSIAGLAALVAWRRRGQ